MKSERREKLINYQEAIKTVICRIEQLIGGNHCIITHLRLSQEERRELRENPTAANVKTLDSYVNSKLRGNWFTGALGLAEIGIILLLSLEDTNFFFQCLQNQHLFLIEKVTAAKRNGGTNQSLVEEVEDLLKTVKNYLQRKLEDG